MVFAKWGGRPHWQYDALRLGEDDHGTWLGVPVGTLVSRPGAAFTTREQQVVLVPDDGYVATFFAAGGEVPCDLYVDITTVATHRAHRISTVDLDLAVRSCEAVRVAITMAAPPFDPDTARGWFDALDGVVMSR